MSDFYGSAARRLQARFETEALADRLEQAIVTPELSEADQDFVASRDFFFLSTVSADGFPTVSYKGGGRGLVAALDPSTLAFPSYDGNGMYLSMGNIEDTAKIGMLFIDFEQPARLRVEATATLSDRVGLLERWPGAELVVVAEITNAWVNCPRYIHRHQRVVDSSYVPDEAGDAPLAPWKRLDGITDALRPSDQALVADAGGQISHERYVELLAEEAGITGSDGGEG
ncbi:MAG: pyridoxamine 5'-phosphate oxidase family protein [Actinomycetota bacterium]